MNPGVFFIATFWTAIGVSVWVCSMLLKNRRVALPVFVLGIASGLIVARLFSAFETSSTLFWEGGWSSLGFGLGFLSATLGVFLFIAGPRSALEFADSAAPALAAGGAIARIGCFVAGCHFGTVTDLPWGIQYPAGSPAFFHQLAQHQLGWEASVSLAVHPVALLESGLLLFGLLVYFMTPTARLDRYSPGLIFLFWALYYSTLRFGLELIRGGTTSALGPLSLAQIACLAGFGTGVLVLTLFPFLQRKIVHAERT
ncbi:MAG: prolipoprotein diacylglyceryl transferase [Acidobacteriota bacterium]|nr:MAG: prolipoprotein diacylglyceryl transferase [Acidobacteriota bacterium]